MQSNMCPGSQVPKSSSGQGCRRSSSTKARVRVQMSAPASRRAGGTISLTPPSSVESMSSPLQLLLRQRPELQRPLSCRPELPSSPLAGLFQAPGPGGGCARPSPRLQSPMILPPMVSQVSLFWGVVLGGGGV